MNIPILYEDNHLIVVEKPPGIPSQEDDTKDADMLTLLKQDIKLRYNKPGNVFLGLVHRLDRPVGGAMLFAKTSKAASRMSEAVRSRQFAKTYICVVHGKPADADADLLHYIKKDAKKNQVTVYAKQVPNAKDARLSYKVIASSSEMSLIAVNLHTGRPHQIRAQMAYIGCPLVGDTKYGQTKQRGLSQIALWSTSIQVPHPISKQLISFKSQPNAQLSPWSSFKKEQLNKAASWYI